MGRQRIDLTGQTFGKLIVIDAVETNDRRTKWLCRCQCGGHKEVYTHNLKSGNTQSCGACTMPIKGRPNEPIKDVKQWEKFGYLTVTNTEFDENSPNRYVMVECMCACQNPHLKLYRRADLLSGRKRDCGKCHEHKPPFKILTGSATDLRRVTPNDIKALGIHAFREEKTNKLTWQDNIFPKPLDKIPAHYKLNRFDKVWHVPTYKIMMLKTLYSPGMWEAMEVGGAEANVTCIVSTGDVLLLDRVKLRNKK